MKSLEVIVILRSSIFDYEIENIAYQPPYGSREKPYVRGIVKSGTREEAFELSGELIDSFEFFNHGVQDWAIDQAILNKDRPLCWLVPGTFWDLRRNRIVERNYGLDLADVRKRLLSVTCETCLEVILRIIHLGFGQAGLIEALGIREIVRNLAKEGWVAGKLFYEATFDEEL